MDFQQSNRYMRPPPPPPPSIAADPLHQPPLRQPVQPPGPWYSGQFQYQPPSPPPPPPHQSWAPPPPPSDHFPPQPPYPAHHFPSQYLPPQPHRPHIPPPYHPHSQVPQSYPQDWGNTNWGHHQGWEYPPRHDEEDWAAKARAWAAAKAGTDNQHPPSQFTPVNKLEGQSYYQDQYQQTVDYHYPDVQPAIPASGYQQYPAPGAPAQKPTLVHPQEYATINSGQSSFVPDEHVAYGARDRNLNGDSNAVYSQQESSSASSLVHMQEVPSSYSSVTGKVETGDQNEKLYKFFPLPTDSSQVSFNVHPPPPAVGRSVSMEQPLYGAGNQATEAPIDLSDQPLNFTRRFNYDHDPMMQQSYNHNDSGGSVRGVDPIAAASLNHTWTSSPMPGTVYPPVPPVLQSAQQHEPSISLPSPVPGHSTPLFGRMSGPSFQPSIPSGPPFGIGAAGGLHPTTAFPGDVYGVPSVSDRPKKASVPNWLKEEIIKKKAVIASSGPERPSVSIEDEAVDKTLGTADQADSKSVDSSRSTEEEDDDEDYVEATKMAAINQEIKRILTEVLLKVTDELFDEVATKVLREDDLIVQINNFDQNIVASDRKLSPSASVVPPPKGSAKVLLAAKAEEIKPEDDSGTLKPSAKVLLAPKAEEIKTEDNSAKSTSSSPGDVLGLASYASDNDEDDDNTVEQKPSIRKLSEDERTGENGNSKAKTESHRKDQANVNNDKSRIDSNGTAVHHEAVANDLNDQRAGRGSFEGNGGARYSSKTSSGVADEHDFDGEKPVVSSDALKTNYSVGFKVMKTEPIEDASAKKSVIDDSRGRETRKKQDKDDTHETRRSSAEKDTVKDVDGGKDRKGEREDEIHRRHDDRHMRKERTSDRSSGLKEKMKEQGGKSEEKAKESDSRKRSTNFDGKEDKKEKERDRRANAKEDSDRRRERSKDEKGERSRDKHGSESSRHKRRRSPSDGSKGRSSKGNSVIGHVNYSSDESSDDSKRKSHMKRRNPSPSPNRSRRRQDSRSPPSRHSQRRHSPFSSLETTRGRRSRSRSPARRQR